MNLPLQSDFLSTLSNPQGFYSNQGNQPIALGGVSTNAVDYLNWANGGIGSTLPATQLLATPNTAAGTQQFLNAAGGMNTNFVAGNGQAPQQGGFLGSLNAGINKMGGWGNVLGGLGTLMQMWASWDGMKLGRDQFNESKRQFNKKWGAYEKDRNAAVSERYDTLSAFGVADGMSKQQYEQKHHI